MISAGPTWDEDAIELYDLRDDLGERKDLAAAMPDKARELQAKLAAWRIEVRAEMPKPDGRGKADDGDTRPAKRKKAKAKG